MKYSFVLITLLIFFGANAQSNKITTTLASEFEWDLNGWLKIISYALILIIILPILLVLIEQFSNPKLKMIKDIFNDLKKLSNIPKILAVIIIFNFTFGLYYLLTNNLIGSHTRHSEQVQTDGVTQIRHSKSDIIFGTAKEIERIYSPLGGNSVSYSYDNFGVTYQELFFLLAINLFLLFCLFLFKE